ncbi:protein FAM83H [Nothobranchius furzeri]|uniref:protein FAM83H n=1 Tax=Nothobranchius furzeri TaxID=105023 RepID=UPI002403B4C9|nr:protein FAM83H [Nothobranchius furzeri]
MARRSQCSSAGDNPLNPNYLPPHYREEYRLAIDALVENSLDGYYEFLHKADVVDFLSTTEIKYIENYVQIPKHISQPEQYFLGTGGDGSSDTYWPVHSDLDVPGLDLGWPQVHAFIEPTEITTLLNPPEPDMPSIKEHARRLIRNAQQVVAVVMDMFTDVDMFLEVLTASSRRVAVYVLLDEVNAHHFVNMVVNCRVNLQDFHFLRVRTVSGITYQCRSGKSFKGQMLDRFLLTDCRAVLSGNYSFMWSFEKLHRCMAHLFLGQFVTTFDEEFRILYAQSQPLIVEDVLAPMDDLNIMHKPQYPNESSSMYREPRKFLSPDSGHPDEWRRHSNEERMEGDWRMIELKNQDSLRGPGDMHSRFATPQSRMEPSFDQGPPRILMTENPALKRHSYAEGAQGRYNFPFMQQQGMPEPELKGKPFHRGQQPYSGPGQESDYSGYDKFWNQDFLSTDQYVEPGLPQGEPPHDNFDPVLNYLSSTRNRDFDQNSEHFLQPSHPKRLNLVQPYVHQTSPTPSNSAEQKPFLQDATANRKDPNVKQGLRDWRISSYLSTCDNPEEEGPSSEPSQAPDAFEEPPNPIHQSMQGMGVSVPKKANFKVPAAHRISQMPSYAKATAQEKPKKYLEEPVPGVVEIRVTPTPSECSSTHEGEKMEEAEQKETANPLLRRDDSFRRKYSSAMQRSSRLRSSLIYSSLEQQPAPQETTTASQHEEESDKNQTEQTKLPFVAHMLGQRKSAMREPFEWSRYLKSATEAPKTVDGSSKADDKDSSKDDSKDASEKLKESIKLPELGRDTPSPSLPQFKPSEVEFSKTDQPAPPIKSLQIGLPYVDMNDPDMRFMFFKELAAKRKAEKEKEKAQPKPEGNCHTGPVTQKEESLPKKTSESNKDLTSEGSVVPKPASKSAEKAVPTEASESPSLSVDGNKNANIKDSIPNRDPNISNTGDKKETKLLEKVKLDMKSVEDLPNLAETEPEQRKSLQESPVLIKSSPSVPRSKPSELKPPQTDQSIQQITSATNQPAKPKIKSPLYMDMSDPDSRLVFFKELAAKRKAEKEKAEIKPGADSNTTPITQKEESLPKNTSENITGVTSEGLIVPNTASNSAGKAVTTNTSESASLSVDDSKHANTKDSVTNRDSNLSYTGVEEETKIPGKLKLDMKSVLDLSNLAETKSGRRKSLQDTPAFIKDSLPQSKSLKPESPEIDQPVPPTTSAVNQPAKPKIKSPLYMDMSDPDSRLVFFKELAAKRKDARAAEAVKEKDKVPIKPQIESKNSPTVLKAPAKETPNSTESSTTEPLVAETAAEETMTREDTNSKDSAVNSEQETQRSISAMPESCFSKSPEEQVVSSPFAKENENFTQKVTPADVSCFLQGTDERQSPTPKSTSKDFISALSNSEESTFSPALPTDPGNLESIQLEPGPSLPSEPETRSELSSSQSLVQSSSSDPPMLNSDSPNSPSIADDIISSGHSPDVSSSTHAPDTSQRAQKSLILSSLESLQSTNECLEKPDDPSYQTYLDPVNQLASLENVSAADSVSVESDVSPSLPETNILNRIRILEELPAATPSMEGSEMAVFAEECVVPGSSQGVTADCTSLAVGLSLPDSSQDVSDLESSSSKHNLEEIVTQDLPLKHSPSESVENTDIDPAASPSEMTLSPQGTPAQIALTLNLNLTDSDARSPAGAEMGSPLSEPDKSVSSPEVKEAETVLPTLDTNSATSETESRTEKSPVHQSTQSESCSSEFASKHSADADLPCKTSESQSCEPAEERSEKQPSVDEKMPDNPEDTKKSTISGTQDSVNSEKHQNNYSESSETAPKQPKVNQSRYHSSTANVLSSSNLRDDTKLLLEQISANCQSRNEATKESPAVTDDEKEDKAEKNAKNIGRRFRGFNRAQPPTQEQEKLIERIQSMRKERRVYSRFEV